MKRRNFLSWVGIGWLTSLLPMAIASCSGKKTESSTRSDGFIAVGNLTALEPSGFLKTKIGDKSVIILRDQAHPDTVRAINPTCTHAGCMVDWESKDKAFECPCHDSRFAGDGKVLEGPAQKPLQTYVTKLEDKTILVKIS